MLMKLPFKAESASLKLKNEEQKEKPAAENVVLGPPFFFWCLIDKLIKLQKALIAQPHQSHRVQSLEI